ncbi:MAG: type II and III secretion system protein family protein [Pseudohongiellaceae bacterium]
MENNIRCSLPVFHTGLLWLFLSITLSASAQEQPFTLGLQGGDTIQELSLPVGKSQIIRSGQPLTQVVVGNPEIADVQLLNESQFLVLGQSPGTTNVAFWDDNSNIVAVLDVVVGFDLEALKRQLNEVLPNESQVEVRSSNGRVVLSGQVSGAGPQETVLALTESYAGENIVNLMQVGGGQQVLLEARIAEVKRNRLRGLAAQTQLEGDLGSETVFDLFTGIPLQNAFGGGLLVQDTSLGKSLLVNLEALERDGAAQVLAEPNIVSLSGQEASFLVGGEFPVPIAQTGVQNAAITIQWKEFGVGLNFTPTVLSDRRINLRLSTEVSDLDTTTGTSVFGTQVPGLRTRRASTTIELGDGNSFAIAGLLQNDISSLISRYPGLGNIPVLGALFRSTDFQREETELVIIMTPRLVRSVEEGDLRDPLESFVPPNRWDLYGLGLPEAEVDSSDNSRGPSSNFSDGGGLDGAQGHQF